MNSVVRHSFVSGGRNPNCELTCGFPLCGHLTPGTNRDGGWCTNRENRVSPRTGWPDGFMPSVASTGGCDLHTSNDGTQRRLPPPPSNDNTKNENGGRRSLKGLVMHINNNCLAFAIINTLIALFFALNAIAQKRSAAPAIPNGLLACLFWWMAFCA